MSGIFAVSGCSSPPHPQNSWVERRGDIATVFCNHSTVSWELTCVNNSWVGQSGNCSTDVLSGGLLHGNGFSLNYGAVLTLFGTNLPRYKITSSSNAFPELAIVLIVAIALVIACCILCVGIVWMKR